MPFARTTLILSTHQRHHPQRAGDGAPDSPMLRHVAVAIGQQFDNRQTMAIDSAAEFAPEGRPITRTGVRGSEQPNGRGNVKTDWRPKQRLERRRVELPSLRKKREDTASVVVEYDNSGVQFVLCCGEQAIQVVQKGEVADEENDRSSGDGGCAECGRDDAVDSVGAAVAYDPQLSMISADEGVDVTDRHAVADDKGRTLGEKSRDFRGSAALEGILFLGQR